MAKKSGESKKVRRIEVEKVKNGDGGHLYKTTTHYHPSKGKEGKGFGESMGKYHEPEEMFHTSHAKAKRHVHQAMGMMTATPDEEPQPAQSAPQPPGGSQDGATGEEDEE